MAQDNDNSCPTGDERIEMVRWVARKNNKGPEYSKGETEIMIDGVAGFNWPLVCPDFLDVVHARIEPKMQMQEIKPLMREYIEEEEYRHETCPNFEDGTITPADIQKAREGFDLICECDFPEFDQRLLDSLRDSGFNEKWATFYLLVWWNFSTAVYEKVGKFAPSSIQPRPAVVTTKNFQLRPFAGQVAVFCDEMLGDEYWQAMGRAFCTELKNDNVLTKLSNVADARPSRRDPQCVIKGNVMPRWSRGYRQRGSDDCFPTACSLRLKLYIGFKSIENGFRYLAKEFKKHSISYQCSRRPEFDGQLCCVAERAFVLARDAMEIRLAKLDDRISGKRPRYRASQRAPVRPVPDDIFDIDLRSAVTRYRQETETYFADKTRYLLQILACLCQFSQKHKPSFPSGKNDRSLQSQLHHIAFDDFLGAIHRWACNHGVVLEQTPDHVEDFGDLRLWLRDSGFLAGAVSARNEHVVSSDLLAEQDVFELCDDMGEETSGWTLAEPSTPESKTAGDEDLNSDTDTDLSSDAWSTSDEESDHDSWVILDKRCREKEGRSIRHWGWKAQRCRVSLALSDKVQAGWKYITNGEETLDDEDDDDDDDEQDE